MHSEAAYVRTCLEAGARGYLLKNAMDLELVAAVETRGGRRTGARSAPGLARASPREPRRRSDHARAGSAATDRARQIEQGDRRRAGPQRQHRRGASRQHHAGAGHPQHRRAGGLRDPPRAGEHRMTRRTFSGAAAALSRCSLQRRRRPASALTDVTAAAGIDFRHNSGAFGAKYLPETLGPGCAFLDYDGDGWLDILLVNGMDWPGHHSAAQHLRLYRNNRNGTFTDVTRARRPRRRNVRHGRRGRRLQQRRLSRYL